jgi:hypothetical protein
MSRGTRYETAEFDTRECAWCTNQFSRTKLQADNGKKYCSPVCAAHGRSVTIPDEHYRRMAHLAHRSRVAGRLRGLRAAVAGLSAVESYLKGYRSGYSAGKAKRRSQTLEAAKRERAA